MKNNLIRLSLASCLWLLPHLSPFASAQTTEAVPKTEETAEAEDAEGTESTEENRAAPGVPDKIRFVAVVQFATSGADRIDARKTRAPLNHKDPLYEGDRIRVNKGAYAKLVLKNGCVAVIYGEASVTMPNREKPWRVRADASRWICPMGQTEVVSIRGARHEIADSEIFINGNRLLVLRGSPRGPGLEGAGEKSLFSWEKNRWVPLKPGASAQAVYEFNETQPAPKESLKLEKPAKPVVVRPPPDTRILFGPAFGGATFMHKQSTYDSDDLDFDGARLQGHFRSGKRSFILAATPFFEASDEMDGPNCFNCPPPGQSMASVEGSLLEAGMRFDHDRWWSPYWRGGISFMKSKLNIRTTNNYFYNRHTEYWGLSAAFGVDAYYRPSWLPWFGLYGMTELMATRGIIKTKSEDKNNCTGCTQPPNPPADPSDPFSLIGLVFGFGLIGQF